MGFLASEVMVVDAKVQDALKTVLDSSRGYLDISEYRALAAVVRHQNSHEDAVLRSAVVPCGCADGEGAQGVEAAASESHEAPRDPR